jgi:hypothetical protein
MTAMVFSAPPLDEDDEHGHVDLRQVSAKVRQPGRHAGEGGVRRGTGRHLEAGVPRLVADASVVELVDVVEVVEEEVEPRVAVVLDGSLKPSKTLCATPTGLSSVFSRNGGMGPNSAAFATRAEP